MMLGDVALAVGEIFTAAGENQARARRGHDLIEPTGAEAFNNGCENSLTTTIFSSRISRRLPLLAVTQMDYPIMGAPFFPAR